MDAQRCDSLKPTLYCSSTWPLKGWKFDRHQEVARYQTKKIYYFTVRGEYLSREVPLLENNSQDEKEVRHNFSMVFLFFLGVMGQGAK